MNAMKILLGAMVAFMVLGGMALAAPVSTSGTTTVTADVGAYLKVTSPGALNLNLAPGSDDLASNSVSTSVMVDSNTGWSLDVGTTKSIAGKDWYGKLYSPTKGFLANAMGIDVGANEFLLSDIPAGHNMAAGSAGSNTINFDLEQQVLFTDPVGNDYSAVIEFDATST